MVTEEAQEDTAETEAGELMTHGLSEWSECFSRSIFAGMFWSESPACRSKLLSLILPWRRPGNLQCTGGRLVCESSCMEQKAEAADDGWYCPMTMVIAVATTAMMMTVLLMMMEGPG